MKFIRKGGRVIPIRESNGSSSKTQGYKAGSGRLVAQGALGAGMGLTGTLGAASAIKAVVHENPRQLAITAGFLGASKLFAASSVALAGYHVAKATRMGLKEGAIETAKQGASWKTGAMLGSIPGSAKLVHDSMKMMSTPIRKPKASIRRIRNVN